MKKVVCGLALLASVLCVPGVMVAEAEEPQPAPMKSLVVYYSYTGNTKLVAKTLADTLKADVAEIEDVTRPTSDQAYGAGEGASREGKSWPIKPFKTDLSGYSRIFVGCPVWFGMPTPQFNAFVEQVSFTGKQVVVFVTLGGGRPEKAIQTMTEKVTAKGGKVVSSFFVKTKDVTKDSIAAKAKEIAKPYQSHPSP
jgi:flavodoxin